jgi:hypothetical protein
VSLAPGSSRACTAGATNAESPLDITLADFAVAADVVATAVVARTAALSLSSDRSTEATASLHSAAGFSYTIDDVSTTR